MSPSQSPPAAQQPPNSILERPEPPESTPSSCRWLGLDRLGVLQVLGGIALGLIALCSSYDHLSLAGRTLQLQQQWGIPLIATSVATVFTGCVQYGAPLGRDAQLATRSRLRAADAALQAAQDAARAEDVAAGRRSSSSSRARSSRSRKKPSSCRRSRPEAMARERQSESFKRLDRAALLSRRVQLDPTPTNRARFQFFLTLIADVNSLDSEE